MNIFKFANGDPVKHTLTGFEGYIVSRTQFMNMCVRYSVQAETLHEGKPIAWQAFDEEELLLVKSKKNKAPKTTPSGGPHPATPAVGL